MLAEHEVSPDLQTLRCSLSAPIRPQMWLQLRWGPPVVDSPGWWSLGKAARMSATAAGARAGPQVQGLVCGRASELFCWCEGCNFPSLSQEAEGHSRVPLWKDLHGNPPIRPAETKMEVFGANLVETRLTSLKDSCLPVRTGQSCS